VDVARDGPSGRCPLSRSRSNPAVVYCQDPARGPRQRQRRLQEPGASEGRFTHQPSFEQPELGVCDFATTTAVVGQLGSDANGARKCKPVHDLWLLGPCVGIFRKSGHT
jgi:hypothetical protein